MKIGRNRGWTGLLVVGLLMGVGGCVQESNVDGARVFQYEWWVPLTTTFLGFTAVAVGWMLRERTERLGWGLVVLSPFVVIFFVPSMMRDRVIVSHDQFHVRTGIWGLTSVHSLKFAEIKEIRLIAERSIGRRGMRTSYYLNCLKTAGGATRVSIGNAVTETSAEAILEEADAHGIPIVDATN